MTVKTADGKVICILGTPEPSEYRIDCDTLTVRRCIGIIPALEREEYNPVALLAARIITGRQHSATLPETDGTVHLLVHPYCVLRRGGGDLLPGESDGRCTAIGKATFFAMMKA